jgi:predicted type IV restriction endonuclease
MSDVDDRREKLRAHFEEQRQLPLTELSEADIRAKFIDPLFVQALGWPEQQIRRERHTTGGEYIDYECGRPITFFLVEAKRAATPFKFPTSTHRRTFQLAGLFQGDASLKAACEQAARYCQDEGIKYAVVSSGVQLVIFTAIRTDRPWRKGEALSSEAPTKSFEILANSGTSFRTLR